MSIIKLAKGELKSEDLEFLESNRKTILKAVRILKWAQLKIYYDIYDQNEAGMVHKYFMQEL